MEFTETELIHIFNTIEVHHRGVQDCLAEVREKITKEPLTFFHKHQIFDTALSDLKAGYDLQIKILRSLECEDDEGKAMHYLEKRRAWVEETITSYEKILEQIVYKEDG